MALRALSLCTGYGGLELGLKLAGVPVCVVGAVERQAYAAAVLAHRMESGDLDPCPVWDDLESFDGRAYRGRVDLVLAGFPCQGASVAGKRRGTDDERWLWPLVWRTVIKSGARALFVENVPGLLNVNGGQAFGQILDDLAARGWSAEWDCVPAGTVGAPHVRDRVFMLAADPNGIELRQLAERDQRQGRGERATERGDAEFAHDGGKGNAADTNGNGPQEVGHVGQLDEGVGPQLGDDPYRCSLSPGWSRIVGRVEPEPAFRRVDDGTPHALDYAWDERLHLLGNGVVPQAAARAWAILADRISR